MRAQIEPLLGDGAKHTYFLKSLKTEGKLSQMELDRLREDLQQLLRRHRVPVPNDDQGLERQYTPDHGTAPVAIKIGAGMEPTDAQIERLATLERQMEVMGALGGGGGAQPLDPWRGRPDGPRGRRTVLRWATAARRDEAAP